MIRKLIFLTTILFAIGFANACSCIQQTDEEHFNMSDAVFYGKVIDVKDLWGEYKAVTFEKINERKGNLSNVIELKTADNSAMCGVEFIKGKEYLVYARFVDGKLFTGLCDGTRSLDIKNNENGTSKRVTENYTISADYNSKKQIFSYNFTIELPNQCYEVYFNKAFNENIYNIHINTQKVHEFCSQMLEQKTFINKVQLNNSVERINVYFDEDLIYYKQIQSETYFNKILNWIVSWFK